VFVMADRQVTRVPVANATRIPLFSILAEAKVSVDAAAAAIETLTNAGVLSPKVLDIAKHLVETFDDMEDRTRAALEDEGGPHAA
jgi:hypothetical protein